MQIETLTSDQVARYLDLATSAVKLSAQNMANVDTPGYRVVGMDFESEMKLAIDWESCESHSSAMAMTPTSSTLKSILLRLSCSV